MNALTPAGSGGCACDWRSPGAYSFNPPHGCGRTGVCQIYVTEKKDRDKYPSYWHA
ncbi:hypothetical protein GF319_07620 [Candidatus Bathyarchaeota archaeon]|nr:hypothetical protein [Candidatus Bathyarchaeota archaeon]